MKFRLNLHKKSRGIPSGADLDSEFLRNPTAPITKENVLSVACPFYDPTGLAAPLMFSVVIVSASSTPSCSRMDPTGFAPLLTKSSLNLDPPGLSEIVRPYPWMISLPGPLILSLPGLPTRPPTSSTDTSTNCTRSREWRQLNRRNKSEAWQRTEQLEP